MQNWNKLHYFVIDNHCTFDETKVSRSNQSIIWSVGKYFLQQSTVVDIKLKYVEIMQAASSGGGSPARPGACSNRAAVNRFYQLEHRLTGWVSAARCCLVHPWPLSDLKFVKMWRNLEIKKRHKLMMMMIEDQETFVHIMVTIKEIRDRWTIQGTEYPKFKD